MRVLSVIRLAVEGFMCKYGKYPPFILISKEQSDRMFVEEGKYLFAQIDIEKHEILGVPFGVVGDEQTVVDLTKLGVDYGSKIL